MVRNFALPQCIHLILPYAFQSRVVISVVIPMSIHRPKAIRTTSPWQERFYNYRTLGNQAPGTERTDLASLWREPFGCDLNGLVAAGSVGGLTSTDISNRRSLPILSLPHMRTIPDYSCALNTRRQSFHLTFHRDIPISRPPGLSLRLLESTLALAIEGRHTK